ncbi:MAG: energy transducer TonB [bacterium]|nr:energy transducer TonB [bacterium]
MRNGLPWSVLIHVLGLLAVFFWGNRVTRAVVQPPRSISVRMQFVQPEPDPVVVREEPAEVLPTPMEEKPPELPPKEVPREPEKQPDPEPVDPTPEPRQEEPTDDPADAAEPSLALSGPAVSADTDFPFAWYLGQVEGRIASNWRPRQLGFRDRTRIACAIHFVIARNGTVSQVTMSESSGLGLYDREALRAVSTTRLPPLPPTYGGGTLGVTFIFNLEPGR